MATIPSNHSAQTKLPIDLAPPTGGARFDRDDGPSFKDHLQDVSRPPVNSDQPQESYEEQSQVAGGRRDSETAVSEPAEDASDTSAELPRDGEEPQGDINHSATTGEESTSENTDSESAVEEAAQNVTTDNASEARAETHVNTQAALENGDLKGAEEGLAPMDNGPTKQGEAPGAATSNDQSEPVPELNLAGSKLKSTSDLAEAKQAEQAAKSVQGEGDKPSVAEDVAVKGPVAAADKAATSAKTDQSAAKVAETSVSATPAVDAKKVAETTEPIAVEKSSEKSAEPQKTVPQKQRAAELNSKAGETVGDEVKIAQPTKEQVTSEPETSGGKTKNDGVDKPKGKNPNPSPATLAQKLVPEVTAQSSAELSSSESIKAATTQVQVSVADGVEVTSPEETSRGPQRIEATGEELKPATNVGARTVEASSESAPRVTSAATEAKETVRTDSTGQHPEVDRVRFVQRVARAFNSVGNQGGTLRLRLSPPELGSLKIEIDVRGSTMTARIEAETSAARTVLLESLPALRERLADQNIKIDKFDVDLLNQSPDDSFRQPAGQQDRQRERSPFGNASNSNGTITADQETSTTNTTPGLGEDTQLNVVV